MGEPKRWRRWGRIFGPTPAQEVDEELRFHLEQRIQEQVARGVDEASARQAALQRLGNLERIRQECTELLSAERRAGERRRLASVSWLDVKLGVRMLRKFPGLTLVALFGMSIAIAISAGYFAFIGSMLDPDVPLPDGDRIVSIIKREMQPDGRNGEITAHEFERWRGELKSLQQLGAFYEETRNLIVADGQTDLVQVAAMTVSAFELTQARPLVGRGLTESDEPASAPSVVVIGEAEWVERFGRDPRILTRTLRLGETVYSIVGVMPAAFAFPVNHRYWIPLRLNPTDLRPGNGPPLFVFGRLADGFSMRQARAELATIGQRPSEARVHRATARPMVIPYTRAFIGADGPEVVLAMRALQLLFSLLLVIVAVNVSVLVYARTATRMSEIAVRSALGASRSRVIGQLFVEALVLSSAASAIGLTIAHFGLIKVGSAIGEGGAHMPFWISIRLSPSAVLFVVSLALLAGVIVGVVPALKVTGKRLQEGLQQFGPRGAGLGLGRTWTTLIVAQVAIAVAALPAALNYAEQSLRIGMRSPADAANHMLRARLAMTAQLTSSVRDSAAFEQALRARFAARIPELIRQLQAEPNVDAVTIAQSFPGTEGWRSIEIEAAGTLTTEARTLGVGVNRVATNFFDVFEIPLLAGRAFTATDARANAPEIIVTQEFARRVAGNASILGRHVRFVDYRDSEKQTGPWLQIVGVVPDFANDFTPANTFDGVSPRMFLPAPASELYPAALVVRTRGIEPVNISPRVRDIAAAVDPDLRLEQLETVISAWKNGQKAFWSIAAGILAVMLAVVLLSSAGIYAMMSFTVTRRRREIGIRAALGANPQRVLLAIFAGACAQLGAGVLLGLCLSASLEFIGDGMLGDHAPALLAGVTALMVTVGLLATLGPARRGLSVQPIEALQSE